ncbi:hypothetical protein E2562_035588 [Oryza meyeriana var. granulata]|uniref:Uncharacterized protein n=1 Tax=Oryza meyeriana var. granulata TaxID=110450 RepID=A0A6G1CBX1_9ORYZ|nr:hypothetical protein E2562_035588 [Oryza meyeriana var. granulata]
MLQRSGRGIDRCILSTVTTQLMLEQMTGGPERFFPWYRYLSWSENQAGSKAQLYHQCVPVMPNCQYQLIFTSYALRISIRYTGVGATQYVSPRPPEDGVDREADTRGHSQRLRTKDKLIVDQCREKQR